MKRKVNKESFEDVVMWALRRECAGHEIEGDDSLYGDLGLDSIDITDVELTIEKKLKSPVTLTYKVGYTTTVRQFIDRLYEQYLKL